MNRLLGKTIVRRSTISTGVQCNCLAHKLQNKGFEWAHNFHELPFWMAFIPSIYMKDKRMGEYSQYTCNIAWLCSLILFGVFVLRNMRNQKQGNNLLLFQS